MSYACWVGGEELGYYLQGVNLLFHTPALPQVLWGER